ncbi:MULTISPECIES: amino acid ABC transporter ATP-binding/permease protein [Clostridium]|jgi:ATP-binding cassette, subfamily C, bacterial|uniref:amino acid ABC transporter ATP-binding/permease protein n=1 Tax=Clostridium TaxID=1485 RepID=UPI00189EB492|nr:MULTISPECIES: ABC transporter ATP-binding protein [Clostridium]MDB1932163.1 ABC transporter ATP-binding protein [Clostridium tertium]MDB1935789.1 ABC transporter ATP-binding protein [Clostridium tertium]MDB1948049.1 ABC transporter ATP-binding protein [Clostridium tertium]MDU1278932.1 ABC transporter ATP-binding protein [Clostridium sp.]MDU2156229.1 ABC transporter ATP-binding protein [Clostridium sp.]
MKRRSGFQIMKRLIVELKPLAPIMGITIFMGVLGFLAAISIASFGAVALGAYIGDITFISFKGAIIVMAISALLRGFLRYGEQLSGHYIAFKILYILRDKIFTVLRKLAPAKLEGKEKGNLIALITSDIELLEVFYAHTIAPISIAIITNSIISIILFNIRPIFGVLAVIFFLIVGFVIPYVSSSFAKEAGVNYRNIFGESNNYVLDSLRGLKEVLLFKNGEERLNKINENSIKLNKSLDKIKGHEGIIRATTDITIMIAILTFVILGTSEYLSGNISFTTAIVSIVIIASSFGPVVALSNLSNTLLQTFACAERIFALLDEKPQVEEVRGKNDIQGKDIEYKNVSFSYPNRKESIFKNTSLNIRKGEKIALIGESGIGKSTFIKLIMRFWDVNSGDIKLDNIDIKDVNTESLRNSQTLVSQETYLFNESIRENIKVGNEDASESDIIEAAKKASIHDFILSLPKGYDTKVSELGGNLSSGERQRIGLARAFLKDSEVLILDEPTSNLDALNEGEILKAINENCKEKTIILISHRKSTTAICDKVYKLENKQIKIS